MKNNNNTTPEPKQVLDWENKDPYYILSNMRDTIWWYIDDDPTGGRREAKEKVLGDIQEHIKEARGMMDKEQAVLNELLISKNRKERCVKRCHRSIEILKNILNQYE